VNRRRRSTLRAIVASFVPRDARIDRVTALVEAAIEGLSPERRAELVLFLDLLTAPALVGPLRAALLRALADAPVAKLRAGFAALKRLSLFIAYAESEPDSPNPTWSRIGYPGPRDDRVVETPLALATGRDGETVAADVVVVGSGAGGGVAAAEFARAGKRVVVLEAGGAYFAQDYTQREQSFADLYLDRGLASSKDLGVVVLAGATLGGGTSVNWCTALRLPERIEREWEMESGLGSLGTDLAPHYAALETELGLNALGRHNPNNAVIVDGCAALGQHHATQPRNAAADCGDGCGYCGFGCAYAKKRSTVRVYLPSVLGAGGAIYAGARAERIVFEGTHAAGVEVRQATADGATSAFVVRAPLVVAAAGALRTPGLLARSGVAHGLLGRRLFLHPVASCFAEFEHSIEAYRGPMQTAFSDAYNYRNGNYGAKVEVAPAHPGLAALAFPWRDREHHARAMDSSSKAATLIALTRDRDPGHIDLDGEAAIHYAVSPFDGEHLLAGLVGLFEIAFAAGATRVTSLHNRPIAIARKAWSANARDRFAERVRSIGVAPNRQPLFSAHQMGTAPLGADPGRSVVDRHGRVRKFEGLLVADASLFPQSSGVNPMLTIMALARHVALANL
jgi:choline dehydrogenase-like flavoprotein